LLKKCPLTALRRSLAVMAYQRASHAGIDPDQPSGSQKSSITVIPPKIKGEASMGGMSRI
jgi:hypothetical protein